MPFVFFEPIEQHTSGLDDASIVECPTEPGTGSVGVIIELSQRCSMMQLPAVLLALLS